KRAAKLSAATLTGMLEISLELDASSDSCTLWARPYIIDENGNPIYGDIKEINTSSADQHTGNSSTAIEVASYDLTEINSDGETDIDFNEPTEKSPFETIVSIFTKLINFIKTVIPFITDLGVQV
ncbi:MAG TPA: hypothetical protein DIW36_08445, partial [Ruminococcaceae bacterium]|nr:hypothetical protein [Oscillospiraceae bacterium]